jgi:hypothetical protein
MSQTTRPSKKRDCDSFVDLTRDSLVDLTFDSLEDVLEDEKTTPSLVFLPKHHGGKGESPSISTTSYDHKSRDNDVDDATRKLIQQILVEDGESVLHAEEHEESMTRRFLEAEKGCVKENSPLHWEANTDTSILSTCFVHHIPKTSVQFNHSRNTIEFDQGSGHFCRLVAVGYF